MRKKQNRSFWLALCLAGLLAGCKNVAIPPEETLPQNTIVSDATTEATTTTSPTTSPATDEASTEAETTTASETETEPASTTEEAASSLSSEESTEASETGGDVQILPTTASGARVMTDTPTKYEYKGFTIYYPQIAGMKDEGAQKWANDNLKGDAMLIPKILGLNDEEDSLVVNYETTVCYRGEFAIVYSGTYKKASSDKTVKFKFTENLNLTERRYQRLSLKLSSAKLIKAIRQKGQEEDPAKPSFTLLSHNIDDETIIAYLQQLDDRFYEDLVATADFGGEDLPQAFSYDYLDSVVVIIQVPHLMGDYVEIAIRQQTK